MSLLCASVLFASPAAKDAIPGKKMHEDFVRYYNEERFDSLVKLFHYPEDQDLKQHIEDSTLLVLFFRGMKQDFGPILDSKFQARKDSNSVSFKITTADTGYWNHQHLSGQIVHELKFAKRGLQKICYQSRIQDMNAEIASFALYKSLPTDMTEEQIEAVRKGMENLMSEIMRIFGAGQGK